MPKNIKNKRPLNFIDLRKSKSKGRPQLIQDIIQPDLKRRWFLGLTLLKRLSRIQLLLSVVILIVIITLCLKLFIPAYNPVPESIRKAVNFQIYYPDPAHLPKGYTLDTSSFSAGNNAVLYTVSYANKQKLIFTVQLKPSDATLQTFNNTVIPLNTTIMTNLGKATIGTTRGETLVSLPTNGSSWIIITAPFNTPQKQLNQVLEAF